MFPHPFPSDSNCHHRFVGGAFRARGWVYGASGTETETGTETGRVSESILVHWVGGPQATGLMPQAGSDGRVCGASLTLLPWKPWKVEY